MTERAENIPIFPLGTVLLPDGLLPLKIFEARYMDMARACLKTGSAFGVCLIREGREVGTPAVPEPIGTLARITTCDMQQLGLLNIVTRGGERFRIIEHAATTQGLIRAEIEMLPEETDSAMDDEFHGSVAFLKRILREHGEGIFHAPLRWDSARWVGHRLADVLPLPPRAKQHVLEMNDARERLKLLQDVLARNGLLRDDDGS